MIRQPRTLRKANDLIEQQDNLQSTCCKTCKGSTILRFYTPTSQTDWLFNPVDFLQFKDPKDNT
eukprot:4216808-Amphidinium_carterae.2